MKTKEVTILMVEDDEIDVDFAKRSFKKARISNPVINAKDGIDALDILRGENGKDQVERPYIVLLDLNMPRMNGIQFLKKVRADPKLRDTVVFVLTTSDADKDRWAAYDQHIAGYILKGNVGSGFMDLISMLECFWRVVELPAER